MEATKKLIRNLLCVAIIIILLALSGRASGSEKIIIGPEYRADPLLTDLGNPKGKTFEFAMPLSESKIFRGSDPTLDPNKPASEKRRVFVYIPAAYQNGIKAPIMVALDGPAHFSEICNALDNLTISKQTERRLPAFILISVENGGGDAKGSQRGLEYDTISDRFARFINDEVLPAVLNNTQICTAYTRLAFTEDPRGKAVMGCSSGGAAAFTIGWFRPDLFGRIISYSGTFVDQQDDDAVEEEKYPLGAWEYHSGIKLIENSAEKPLRVFIQASENDLGSSDFQKIHRNWTIANERMAAALKAAGYDYRYVFSLAAGHCDSKVFKHTLAETLLWIWHGYKTN